MYAKCLSTGVIAVYAKCLSTGVIAVYVKCLSTGVIAVYVKCLSTGMLYHFIGLMLSAAYCLVWILSEHVIYLEQHKTSLVGSQRKQFKRKSWHRSRSKCE